MPVGRVDLARGGATTAPAAIGTAQVVEHGLRHLAWLAEDDPVVAARLDDPWRQALADAALIRHCAAVPVTAPTDAFTAACYTLCRLAQRVQALTAEERELQRHITTVLNTHAPHLLQRHGIGPDSASVLLVTAGDNRDRISREASFAALCGVSPIEASSGKTRRRRLNRGGDRRANAALYRIALTRARSDQRTRDYLDRRTAQGRTRREAIRCIKRYIAREIYHLIQQLDLAQPTLRMA